MERILLNLEAARRVTKNGRTYLVAPITLITEGVLNGSQGSLFYPFAEMSRNYRDWDGTPIVEYHPHVAGQPTSAYHPEIAPKHLGILKNTRTHPDSRKLRTEGWFDEQKTRKHAPRIYNALVNRQPMEISTGLYTDNEPKPGNYRGKTYAYIARNYRPDHLAVLPDQVGACSLHDGCGLNVNRAVANVSVANLKEADFVSLPKGVKGTNCGNCKFQSNGICQNAKLKGLKVDSDDCCGLWDNVGAKRPWQEKATENCGSGRPGPCPGMEGGALGPKDEEPGEIVEDRMHPEAPLPKGLKMKGKTTENAASHGEVRDRLSQQLRSNFKQNEPTPYINDVYDDHVIYEHGGKTFKHKYEKDEDGAPNLKGKPIQVERKVSYEPTGNTQYPKEGETMVTRNLTRDQLVEAITTNCGECGDAETLNALPDPALSAIYLGLNARGKMGRKGMEDDDDDDEEDSELEENATGGHSFDGSASPGGSKQAGGEGTRDEYNKGGGEDLRAPATKNRRAKTTEEYLADAPAEVREAVTNAMQITNEEKVKLVKRLTANVADKARRKQLQLNLGQKPLAELREMVELLPVENRREETTSIPTFEALLGGLDAPPTGNAADDEKSALPLPTMNYKNPFKKYDKRIAKADK